MQKAESRSPRFNERSRRSDRRPRAGARSGAV